MVVQVDVLCAVIVACGLTVTVTVNIDPIQVPVVGVTLYVAVNAPAVVLLSVPFTVLCADADAPPVTPACTAGVAHAYVVPEAIVPVGL
jgi:hypothetical protein